MMERERDTESESTRCLGNTEKTRQLT